MNPKEILESTQVFPETDKGLKARYENTKGELDRNKIPKNTAWTKVRYRDGTVEYWERPIGTPADAKESAANGMTDRYPNGAGSIIGTSVDPTQQEKWAKDSEIKTTVSDGVVYSYPAGDPSNLTRTDTRTPEEQQEERAGRQATVGGVKANTQKTEMANAQEVRDNAEREANRKQPGGRPETDVDKAARLTKERSEGRRDDLAERNAASSERRDAYAAGLDTWKAQVEALNARAQAVRQSFADQIASKKLSLDAASQKWEAWKAENYDLPLAVAKESRARVENEQATNNEERRRAEYGATDEAKRAEFAYDAGQDAINQSMKLMPYRAGKGFAENAAAAINNLRKGEGFDGWTGENFKIEAPSMEQLFNTWAAKAQALMAPTADRLGAAQASDTARSPIPSVQYAAPVPSVGTVPPPPIIPSPSVTPPDPAQYAPALPPPPRW